MILDIDHCQEDPQIVLVAQYPDARIYVFGMQAVIFETQEESTSGGAEDVVGWDVAVFPRERFYVVQGRIAFLTW